jgi:hypothetical protein
MNQQEAYRLLNLPSDPPPTPEEIKHAYHVLAQKYHPDHNPDRVAHDVFIMIDKAYKFLTSGQPAPNPPRPASAPAPAQPSQTTSSAHFVPVSDPHLEIIKDLLFDCGSHPEIAGVKLVQLHKIAEHHKIPLQYISKSTQRPVKKNKTQLYGQIIKLEPFIELCKKSYDQLLEMCQEQQIPTKIKSKPKSITEMVIDLMEKAC